MLQWNSWVLSQDIWPSSCQQFPLPLQPQGHLLHQHFPRQICHSLERQRSLKDQGGPGEAQPTQRVLGVLGIYGGFMVDLWGKKILIPVQVVQPNTGFQDVSGCKLSAIDIKTPASRGFSSIHVFTQKYLGGWRKKDQIGELESLIGEHWTHEMGTT